MNYALGMDALLLALPRTRTRTELWFGHGCTRYHMLLEHKRYLWFGHGCTRYHMFVEQERNYGVGTDALVAVCS